MIAIRPNPKLALENPISEWGRECREVPSLKDILEIHSPLVLWDYSAELKDRMCNTTANNLFQLQGQNLHMVTFGTEGDISAICQYKWYEWVYFWDGSQQFPFMREVLGRYLGPAKNEGNEMTVWILKMNGKIVPGLDCGS